MCDAVHQPTFRSFPLPEDAEVILFTNFSHVLQFQLSFSLKASVVLVLYLR